MPVFVPPVVADRARDQRAEGVVRRWPAYNRGVNVWKKTDGTYTEIQPAFADISKIYLGAHSHTITSAEATSLTSAGYGANIT